MHLETIDELNSSLKEYVSDALEAVRVKFVDDSSNASEVKSYPVEFAYQQFGDTEKIVGYKNLRITLIYSDLTMHSYLKIEHDGLLDNVDNVKPDDIHEKIVQVYPNFQPDCLIDDWPEFGEICQRQDEFKPFGEKVTDFTFDGRKFQLYKVMQCSEGFESYIARIQTLTMWFVEGCTYMTIPEDDRYMHYLLFEERDDFKTNPLKFAGYMSLYRFYAYPDLERVRFAQVLILPSYRGIGLGPKFLGSIFDDISQNTSIVDTTAEEPADAFILMRDHVDCVRCKPMPELSFDNLKKGFNKELFEKVRKQLKICKFRRVYEILYLYYIKSEYPEEQPKFDAMLKKRLETLFKQSNREVSRMNSALDEREQAIVSAQNQEERIQESVDATLEVYNTVIRRLIKYEPLFQK